MIFCYKYIQISIKKLRIYGKKSGHNPENIGYNLNFNPIKDKYSNKYTYDCCLYSYIFSKPVKDASGYALNQQ
jgi:hypothetical protein